MKKKPCLWIVVPCYNESDVLPITAPIFLKKMMNLIEQNIISNTSRILFVDDGSSDSTWDIISKLSADNYYFQGIRQSRNRGHQSTVLAGLMEAKKYCDITISIDCDGQDDVNAMDEMVNEYINGCEVVYGVRSCRDTDTWFKRTTAQGFYKVLNKLGVEVVYNHADYRLVSSRVLDEFSSYHEVNLFLRGMFPLVGFKSSSVYYERNERIAGSSHYTLKKMITLALDGITSLSIKPIRIVTSMGVLVSLLGFAGIIWAIAMAIMGRTIEGWTSTICIVCFMGGIQLLSLGVIGEYVGKTYVEVKGRPRYIICERTRGLTEYEE